MSTSDRRHCLVSFNPRTVTHFGAPFVWPVTAGESGSMNAAAVRQGVPMIATEPGGGGGVQPDMVQLAVDGIDRVLDELALRVPESTSQSSRVNSPITIEATGQHDAQRSGLFAPVVSPQDAVQAGELLGTIFSIDEPRRGPLKIQSRQAGVVVCVSNRALVERGDRLVKIGALI